MRCVVCNANVCYCVGLLFVCFISGMHNEGTGREVQAAGSPGGSDAEGAEVPPAAEGGLTQRTRHQHTRTTATRPPGNGNASLFTFILHVTHPKQLFYRVLLVILIMTKPNWVDLCVKKGWGY